MHLYDNDATPYFQAKEARVRRRGEQDSRIPEKEEKNNPVYPV